MPLSSFFPRPLYDAAADAAAAAALAAAKPWYEGQADVDAEAIGYFQARGWDKDPKLAAVQAGRAHREATKKLGVPEDQLARIPKKDDVAAWEQFHQKVNGKPADMKDYDFSNVKRKDGTALPDSLAGTLRTMAHKLNLPKDAGPVLAKDFLAAIETADAAAIAEREAAIASEHDKLHDNWKAGFETNMLIARRTATTLGITEDKIAALEKVVGYSGVMNMLRNIGGLIGEDKYLKPGDGGPARMTKEMAVAKISELKNDRDWSKRYLAGGAAEAREFSDLHTVAFG